MGLGESLPVRRRRRRIGLLSRWANVWEQIILWISSLGFFPRRQMLTLGELHMASPWSIFFGSLLPSTLLSTHWWGWCVHPKKKEKKHSCIFMCRKMVGACELTRCGLLTSFVYMNMITTDMSLLDPSCTRNKMFDFWVYIWEFLLETWQYDHVITTKSFFYLVTMIHRHM